MWGETGHAHEWDEVREYHNHGDATAGPKQKSNVVAVTDRGVVDYAMCACGAWRGTLGNEPTPELYVQHIVEVFREVRRVLRTDGIAWLNLGDSYAGSGKGPTGHNGIGDQVERQGFEGGKAAHTKVRKLINHKPKDMLMIPYMVAMALKADGWHTRSDPPWIKENSMPESVRDRFTNGKEVVFMLTRSPRVYFDLEAVRIEGKEWTGNAGTFSRPASDRGVALVPGNSATHRSGRQDRVPSGRSRRNTDAFLESLDLAIEEHEQRLKYLRHIRNNGGMLLNEDGEPIAFLANPQPSNFEYCAACDTFFGGSARDRITSGQVMIDDEWQMMRFCPECGNAGGWVGHFAMFPDGLVEPMLKASVPPGGTALDIFSGAGTTAMVADRLGLDAIGIEANLDYLRISEHRLAWDREVRRLKDPLERAAAYGQTSIFDVLA